MATSKLQIKLLVDKQANRVLFAEAGKDFVDFLFSLLSLPVSSVIKLLAKRKMVGSIANIYQSLKSLDERFILQPQIKNELLLIPKPASAPAPVYYTCSNNGGYHDDEYFCLSYSSDPTTRCGSCSSLMSAKLTHAVPKNQLDTTNGNHEEGYVKGVVTYMVMDDLTVKPMSSISSITLLKKFNVKDVYSLEERVVDLGVAQCLELLKASLRSKKTLSEVFLRSNVKSVTTVDENMEVLMTSFWPKTPSDVCLQSNVESVRNAHVGKAHKKIKKKVRRTRSRCNSRFKKIL